MIGNSDVLNAIELLPWDTPDEMIPGVLAERARRYGMHGAG